MNGREADWRKLKKLKETALERLCNGILVESRTLSEEDGKSAHERYLALYNLIRERDRELGDIFDGHSRSRADQQLAMMCAKGLITDEELATFSAETQEIVAGWQGLWEET